MGKSISEIKKNLKIPMKIAGKKLCGFYEQDSRIGVQNLAARYRKKQAALVQERERLKQMHFYEEKYSQYRCICGIDEAGRGPLAGPVVAGAVILPADCEILYLNDSKKLSAAREKNCMMRSWRRQLRQESEWQARQGLMRSISCRQRMRQCGRQYQNFPESRIFCSMMR